jgi:hypothetical protein
MAFFFGEVCLLQGDSRGGIVGFRLAMIKVNGDAILKVKDDGELM